MRGRGSLQEGSETECGASVSNVHARGGVGLPTRRRIAQAPPDVAGRRSILSLRFFP